jgi:hypothetical protein
MDEMPNIMSAIKNNNSIENILLNILWNGYETNCQFSNIAFPENIDLISIFNLAYSQQYLNLYLLYNLSYLKSHWWYHD